jgi:hypothetical protein
LTDAERWVVETALEERYGSRVEIEIADVELMLAPGDEHLATCPSVYWEARGAAFVISKTAHSRYRSMFFYPGDFGAEQYGTGRAEYDDLADCVTTVLRVQADHEKERHGVSSGKTARELEGIGEHDLDDAGPAGPEA